MTREKRAGRNTVAAKKKKKKYRGFWIFVKVQFVLSLLVLGGLGYYVLDGYASEVNSIRKEADSLVRNSTEETFRRYRTSVVYAADGSVISRLNDQGASYYLKRDEIPQSVIDAVVCMEDQRFYQHRGVDFRALVRAAKSLIENRKITQGGSTITMQLARNVFLTQEKTWQRKVEEIFIAQNLEKKYTKDQILEFYLNNIYYGNGYYGIGAAGSGYFDSEVGDLDLSQIAFLCAVPNNPTVYDPVTHMDHAVERRDRILGKMRDDGKITQMAYAAAVAENITLKRPEAMEKNNYVETYAYYCATRALMEQEGFVFRYQFATEDEREAYEQAYSESYSECQKQLYTEGYQIYTSFDLQLQEELQAAVDDTLSGFTEKNDEGVYDLQGAAVCIDNDSGYVRAMVGGREQDFDGYTLNRAYQSYRQPGSAIKPLTVYTPSFERNYTPESIVVDEPVEDGPKNANGTYLGNVTVRTAVEKSINTIAWKLYEELTPQVGLSYLENMHFSRLDAADYVPATALGGFTNGVSPLEMAAGYAALANDGMYREPTCIMRITDDTGAEVYLAAQEGQEVYRQNAARMMTDVLKGVFINGTGRGLGLSDMPCAGKTGTTNDHKDGWLVGYTRYYTTSVWVGYDMPKEMDSLMGNTYPGKIWQTFMEQAHEGLEWLDFLPYTQIPDASSGEMEAEDAATDEGNAQGETPAENGDTPQENVTDTPDTPQGSATDVPSSSQENGQGISDTPDATQEQPSDAPQQNTTGTSQENASDVSQENAAQSSGENAAQSSGENASDTPQETAPGAP